MTAPPTLRFTSDEVVALTGLSYRQLDHHISRLLDLRRARPGSGQGRRFSAEEVETLAVFAELLAAGLTARAALAIATSSPEFESGHVQIRVDVPAVHALLQEKIDDRTER